MKIRLDYVTNSSSSSFILGFANEAAIRKTLEMEQLGKYFGRIYNDCLTATKMNLSEMIECNKSKTKSNTRYFVKTEILDNNLEKYFRMKENGELDKLCNVVIDKRIENMKEDAEKWRANMIEAVADQDEELMMKYLDGEELTAEEIEFGNPQQGIMIETPAAVMVSGELAKEVDFFSIGTNDLTQYTLAIDRQNAKLDNIYDSHHEAVLRMIQMVIDNAHKEGIWAGICGELGADTTLTERFIQMGIDELSVSPTFVLPVRKIVRELD